MRFEYQISNESVDNSSQEEIFSMKIFKRRKDQFRTLKFLEKSNFSQNSEEGFVEMGRPVNFEQKSRWNNL